MQWAAQVTHARDSGHGSAGQVVVLFLAYAFVHSAFASGQAKAWARSRFGDRLRNGVYRFLFNVQAVVLLVPAGWIFWRLPDRTLYQVPQPWSWLLHLGQAAGIGLMLVTAKSVGIGGITGLRPLWMFLRGDTPPAEPEAQGPVQTSAGEMRMTGPFRYTRHPANWGPLPAVLLWPRMTVNRATLAVLSVAYLVLGSLHEELRLTAAYGAAYERYRRSVPFLLGLSRPPPG